MEKKLVVIDGNSIANRAFYALPPLSNANGMHTNAVFGFTTMLLRVLDEQKPSHLLVAFDAGKVVFRHQEYKDYKGGRQKTPSELSEQFPYMKELLDAFGIVRYELEGYEADDIIGTLTKQADEEGVSTVIVTGDKDMLQLVSDRVHVALTRKGISEVEWFTPESIEQKYGLKPQQIIDLKGLMGDASDNIPGIPGVGEKTALKLLHEFQSVENVLANVEGVSGKKLKEKIAEHQEDALKSKELATILRTAPLDIDLESTVYEGYETDKVWNIFKKFEFKSLMERIGRQEEAEEQLAEVDVDFEFTVITSDNRQAFEPAFKEPCAIYLELNEENYHRGSIVGMGVTGKSGTFYVSSAMIQDWPALHNWLRGESPKIVHDAKRTVVALRWHGLELNSIEFDIKLASYLLNPSETDFSLQEVARRACGMALPSDDSLNKKSAKTASASEEELAEIIARRALAIQVSGDSLRKKIKEDDLSSLFFELELPLSLVLAEMELSGIKVDLNQLVVMGKELEEKLHRLTNEIHELVGESFNINSPKQLGEILFDKLQLPVVKKTKTGYSTSADVLEKLQDQHPVIPSILHFRQLGKLYSTYIEGLIKEVNPQTGKIHTSYNQATTATGRLSSTEPNLQNIPIRLEEGRKIRQAFIPSKENWVILAADYSQIELRVLAHIADDKNLKEAFLQGADIHTKTAMDVFGVEAEDVTSEMRRQAKAVNFGIVYGISDYGLSQNLNITRKEAAMFIERYFDVFTGVKQYMDDIVMKARQDGFVTTLLKRRRYLPEITHSNFNIRSFAERTAMNTPIQGTAADIIKLAMVHMGQALKEKGLQSRMLLQVHDELVFEVPEEELDIMKELVPQIMEQAIELQVPLVADVSYGESWYEAK
ncbi:DNA polymerase I [Ammoniphilus sp. YIM 78166]|uniref:DNA polymerase I n=1 Tax=Ammoniphilus sp. YIM 78166 TaxID=1644106 RepID=UPI0010702E0C|nr:DNA polymerase I [Ammoniphilus sp. YIM 78166]